MEEAFLPTKRPLASDAPLFELGDVYRVLMYHNKNHAPAVLEASLLYVRFRYFLKTSTITQDDRHHSHCLCALQGPVREPI